MSKSVANITAKGLLDAWTTAGLVKPAQTQGLEAFIVSQQRGKELPVYLRAFAGAGAFISFLCFIGFMYVANIFDYNSETNSIVLGVIFIISAVVLAKALGEKDSTVRHNFLMQLSFCFMAAGKFLFIIGVAGLFPRNSGIGAVFATFLITLALYNVYRMSVDRFLSSLAAFLSLFVYIVFNNHSGIGQIFGFGESAALNVFIFLQIALLLFLFVHDRIGQNYIPLAYAAVFSLCISVIFLTSGYKLSFLFYSHIFNLTLIKVFLTLTLIALIGWAAGSLETLKTEPVLAACIGAALLGYISTPGIMLSLCLMVLGYAKHETVLSLLGVLLMPVFVFFYYYNLDVSLLAKSAMLMGSGAVLLAGWGYLVFRKLDGEVLP